MGAIPEDLLAACYRFALRLTRNRHAAEGLSQDALLRVWSAWGRPHEPRALRVYLFRTVLRRWQDLARRRPAAALVGEPAARGPGAERQALLADDVAAALALLDRLPEQQRLAVHLVAVEELTLEEAAAAVGSTPGAVKANLSLARAKLRAWTEAEEALDA